MYKSLIVLAAFICAVNYVSAKAVPESGDVKLGMKDAFQRGLKRFGVQRDQENESERVDPGRDAVTEKVKIFSQYTKDLTAQGGGKPSLAELHAKHHYVPPAPISVPLEVPLVDSEYPTAEETAKLLLPRPPLQHHTDKVFIP